MEKTELNSFWNYYLSIENDLSDTSQFIEPNGQENVYSFEFAKLLILACTEVEAVFKAICLEINGKPGSGDIGEYKKAILTAYPRIVETEVSVDRLGRTIKPFDGWDKGKLCWWDAYQLVKHNRKSYFTEATYMNATMAISALYILIFYLSKITNISFSNYKSKYISSAYVNPYILCKADKELPDFE